MKEAADTAQLLSTMRGVAVDLQKQDRDVEWSGLTGGTDSIYFLQASSDLASGIREVVTRFEGKNLTGIILVSDGIYNNGLSPLYLPLRIPVYTVGAGDTTERSDIVLKNVAYNRIVYQGNKFLLRAEVGVIGLPNRDVTVTIQQKGKLIQQQKKNSNVRQMLDFDFQLEATSKGVQRFEIRVEPVASEANPGNNKTSAFVEVVEGRKKILLIAPAPHPDIKVLRTVVEKNSNYEFIVHIPGIKEAAPASLNPKDIDLLIAHQSPDQEGKTNAILTEFLREKSSAFIIIGQKTQLRMLPSIGVPLNFAPSGQRDEVQPVLNPDFHDLGFSDDLNTAIYRYPPVTVPFGKFSFPVNAKVILKQRIGSLVTDRPQLYTVEEGEQKLGVLIGDGIWKWRLNEFQESEKTASFDELMSKLLQYLSTRDDRRKFRCFPLQQEFTSDAPAVLESQVYNDLFEPVYGNIIDIELRDEQGKVNTYRYTTGSGNSSRYRIGGLKEGIYKYRASTDIKGKKEEVRGEFLIIEQNQESQNLTADFGLLRKLAESTGGKFYTLSNTVRLSEDIRKEEAKSVIHTEETFNPLINLKLVFFLLLALISVEWVLRKYFGSY